MLGVPISSLVFFFNDTATTEIYTLSLHDALPISRADNDKDVYSLQSLEVKSLIVAPTEGATLRPDRKSTRLNSSHGYISYAVFCLKKKNGSDSEARGSPSSRSRRCSNSTGRLGQA